MTNNNSIVAQNQASGSPFDVIRHFDSNGNEYWNARELMKVLGYDKWQNFHKNIKKACAACKNSQNQVTEHFLLTSVKGSGRSADDWKLSRMACYLIVMNGDPDKLEIAQAQTYFATKVREAELIIPAQNDRLLELQLELELEKERNKRIQLQENRIAIHGLPIALLLEGKSDAVVEVEVPTIEVIDQRHNVRFKGQTLTQVVETLKNKYGIKFKSGAELKRYLERKNKGHLITQTLRSISSDYVPLENIEYLYNALLADNGRQKLIGE